MLLIHACRANANVGPSANVMPRVNVMPVPSFKKTFLNKVTGTVGLGMTSSGEMREGQ